MKKKEREHLKEDPFQHFIEKAYETLRKYQKMILIGIGAIVAVIIIIILVVFIKSNIASGENRTYSYALRIKNAEWLNVDQKIEKLAKLNSKSGISAAVKLFLASLYFEKGDLAKANEVLKSFSKSSSGLINSEKKLLEAEILNASDKSKEALDLLNTLFVDPKSEVPKDFTLLKMAKIQLKNGQLETATTNLNKILDDYPQSFYTTEAKNLLKGLAKK